MDLEERLSLRIKREQSLRSGTGNRAQASGKDQILTNTPLEDDFDDDGGGGATLSSAAVDPTEDRPEEEESGQSEREGNRNQKQKQRIILRQYPPHICVLKSIAWNSNQIPREASGALGAGDITASTAMLKQNNIDSEPATTHNSNSNSTNFSSSSRTSSGHPAPAAVPAGAQFIFHAVGNWNKGQVLHDVITSKRDSIWPPPPPQGSDDGVDSDSTPASSSPSFSVQCRDAHTSHLAAVSSKLEELGSVVHDFRLIRGVGLDFQKNKKDKDKDVQP